ncbi:hypothetical protein A1O3_08361 [Capronia epimyces CBS 606.96]|uniref:AB hydrolase-1 domain-containing protein n=1 Tax=Capronia epimyces CBS 606.96 TaxID=1182542 RepID=W9XRW4_9EURO|nr:uncharacterized protein A1O3_08361 [Capronia epimyces CBS 606.96]EXJ80075.1 hypothetical protein A1O3_08361 [Capronia epimyces CBS 606.96]
MAHNYLLSISALAERPEYGIPVVFYDQIGSGRSTHLREKRLDEAFWKHELFIAELDNPLGIADDFDLLGQSWGAMLGAIFAIRGHRGLRRLIISNSPLTLSKHEADKTNTDPEYLQAVEYFYNLQLYRNCPFPKDLLDALARLGKMTPFT